VHIGPVAVAQYGGGTIGVANPLDDNPRCLKRDLNAYIAKRFTSFYNTTSLILGNSDVEHFQAIMQADPRYVHGELGVHGGGHFTMGGDPGSDPFISPGDPAFFLHHSQIDRVFWIWQLLDLPNRQVCVFSFFGLLFFLPPSFPRNLCAAAAAMNLQTDRGFDTFRTCLELDRLWTSSAVLLPL